MGAVQLEVGYGSVKGMNETHGMEDRTRRRPLVNRDSMMYDLNRSAGVKHQWEFGKAAVKGGPGWKACEIMARVVRGPEECKQ